jgi:Uma2 family endonuclease
MRSAPVRTALSFDEFLEFEAGSRERHEFVDGNLFVMAGGSDRQNHVVLELVGAIKNATRAAGLRVYASDVLIRTPSEVGYYPDVYVAREEPGDTALVKRHPIVIVEVLSASTEVFDRGEKWQNYQTIPSLEQYILLSQSAPLAEVYERQSDGAWRYQSYSGQAMVRISSISFDLPLEVLYVDLPE